jgi:hypothetical protein
MMNLRRINMTGAEALMSRFMERWANEINADMDRNFLDALVGVQPMTAPITQGMFNIIYNNNDSVSENRLDNGMPDDESEDD